MSFVGIDYGSKVAGTTAIAYLDKGRISFAQSRKKEDADIFIYQHLSEMNPKYVFLDAPLSLPGVFNHPESYNDYFFRQADRAAGGMSPMFLGGLTARAMQLKGKLSRLGIQTFEVYPGALAKVFKLSALGYKKKSDQINNCLSVIQKHLPYAIQTNLINNWHQFDALLAFTSGWRYLNQLHITFGELEEGIIII